MQHSPAFSGRLAGRWLRRAVWWGWLVLLGGGLPRSGAAQPALGPSDWRLEWAEEFNQPGDSSSLMPHWRFDYPWGRNLLNNSEVEYYAGSALSLVNGQLLLTARPLPVPRRYLGKPLRYESGMLYSQHPVVHDSLRPATCDPQANGFSYGLFEIRCRMPHDPAGFPAFWLFGDVDEIDVFEGAQAFSNNTILRRGGYWRPGKAASEGCACYYFNSERYPRLDQSFHTYGLAWLPDELVFYFDGRPIRREGRFTPLGCSMSVIVNLAVSAFSAATSADTLAIDYLRIYRPRRVPAAPLMQRPGGARPHVDLAWLPFSEEPGRPDPAARQRWQVVPAGPGRLALNLTDNYNPNCNARFALPESDSATWHPTWVLLDDTPALEVGFSQPVPVEWALCTSLGEAVAQGRVPAGHRWRPAWPVLLPGAYHLWLRQGPARAVQPVMVLARPRHSLPDAAWELPAPIR